MSGKLAEQGRKFPCGEVGIPGAEDAKRVKAVLVVKVEKRIADHLEEVGDT